MDWLDKQDLLDEAEKLLLVLHKVRKECAGMQKVKDLLYAKASSNSTILRELLARYA
jgi:hypothetical protein